MMVFSFIFPELGSRSPKQPPILLCSFLVIVAPFLQQNPFDHLERCFKRGCFRSAHAVEIYDPFVAIPIGEIGNRQEAFHDIGIGTSVHVHGCG